MTNQGQFWLLIHFKYNTHPVRVNILANKHKHTHKICLINSRRSLVGPILVLFPSFTLYLSHNPYESCRSLPLILYKYASTWQRSAWWALLAASCARTMGQHSYPALFILKHIRWCMLRTRSGARLLMECSLPTANANQPCCQTGTIPTATNTQASFIFLSISCVSLPHLRLYQFSLSMCQRR